MKPQKMIESAEMTVKQGFMDRLASVKDSFKADRAFTLFLIVGALSGIANGIHSTTFNNFLSEIYHLSAAERGIVEFPREMPGVLIMFVLGVLSFMGNIRMAALGMLFAALGMVGLGLFSPTYASMLVWMMVLSLGTHIFIPLAPAIGMDLSEKSQYGIRLGRYNAYNLAATILGYGIVWLGFRYLNFNYTSAFVLAALFFVASAVVLGMMKPDKPQKKKMQFVFRKKYMLFYALSIVNGARKQIFMTFAPWVLIQVFNVDTPTFAVLGFVVSVVSILTRTIVGNGIDKLGERFILCIEAVILIVICMGYAFAENLFPVHIAVIIIAACYIIDNSLTAVGMARSTYVKKIAVQPEDVTPTLSAGTSFDHVVAMSIPYFGGLVWASLGYQYVFLCAAAIAVINLLLSLRVKID